jgi:hypothetical protein
MSVLLRKGAYAVANAQTLVTGASSNVTYAFSNVASILRVTSNQDAFIAWGANPTAYNSGNCMLIVGGGVEFIAVNASDKVAAIQSTSSGLLNVVELKSQ